MSTDRSLKGDTNYLSPRLFSIGNSIEIDPNEIEHMQTQKEMELTQLNQLRVQTLERIIEEKMIRIDELEGLVEHRGRAGDNYRGKLCDAEQECHILRDKMEESRKDTLDAHMAISQLKAEVDESHRRLIQERSRSNELERTLQEVNMKVEADLEQIKLSYREELDSQTEKLLEEINRLKIIVNEKQEMVHDCDKIVENQRLIGERREQRKVETICGEYDHAIESKNVDITRLEAVIGHMEKHHQEQNLLTTTRFEEIEQSEQGYKEFINNLERVIEVKNTSILTLEEEISKTKKNNYEDKYTAEREMNYLMTHNNELKDKLEDQKERYENEIQNTKDKGETEVQDAKKRYERKLHKIENKMNTLQNEKSNYEILERQHKEREDKEIYILGEENKRLKGVLERENERLILEKTELDKLICVKNLEAYNEGEEKKYFKRKLTQKESEIEDVKLELESSISREKVLQDELDEILKTKSTQIENLKNTLGKKNDVILNTLKAKNEQLGKDIENLHNELTEKENTQLKVEIENQELKSQINEFREKEALTFRTKTDMNMMNNMNNMNNMNLMGSMTNPLTISRRLGADIFNNKEEVGYSYSPFRTSAKVKPVENKVFDSIEQLRREFNQNIAMLEESHPSLYLDKKIGDLDEDRIPTRDPMITGGSRPVGLGAANNGEVLEEFRNKQLEITNLELKTKVIEDEKSLMKDELNNIKEELLKQREENLEKEKDKYTMHGKISGMEEEIKKLKQERERMGEISTELRGQISGIKNQNMMQSSNRPSIQRVQDLESQVRILNSQLKRWNTLGDTHTQTQTQISVQEESKITPLPPLSVLSNSNSKQIRARTPSPIGVIHRADASPNIYSRPHTTMTENKRFEESGELRGLHEKVEAIKDRLMVEGVQANTQDLPLGHYVSNTGKQTHSQLVAQARVRSGIARKKERDGRKARNYNLKEGEEAHTHSYTHI